MIKFIPFMPYKVSFGTLYGMKAVIDKGMIERVGGRKMEKWVEK